MMKHQELVEQTNNISELIIRLTDIIKHHLPATTEPINALLYEYNRIVRDIHEEYKNETNT